MIVGAFALDSLRVGLPSEYFWSAFNRAMGALWGEGVPIPIDGGRYRLVNAVIFYSLPILLAIITYSLLARQLGLKTDPETETHCRKRGYIPRGITEPRCPECGEKI